MIGSSRSSCREIGSSSTCGISHEKSPPSQGIAYVDNDYPGAQESSFAPDESPQLRITFRLRITFGPFPVRFARF
jgi:hypothetical protein